MKNFKLSHIGWAVFSIEKALPSFHVLGYKNIGEICNDVSRKVKLLLLSDGKKNLIELVEPFGKDSPVFNLLQKNGPFPYHVCFSVNNSESESCISRLKKTGFIELNKPADAPAINGNKVIFLYSSNIGLIEIVFEKEEVCN